MRSIRIDRNQKSITALLNNQEFFFQTPYKFYTRPDPRAIFCHIVDLSMPNYGSNGQFHWSKKIKRMCLLVQAETRIDPI